MNALDQTFARPETDRQASGYKCPAPVVYEHQGEVWMRDCGHCPRCVAAKKKDTAGRAGAEALVSAEVAVWTLTYGTLERFPLDGRPWVQAVDSEAVAGAADFQVKHRQDFMKRVRDFFWQEARRKVGAPRQLHRVTTVDGRREDHADMHVKAYWLHLIDQVLVKVRYIGCGERGEKNTRRCHWHLAMFLNKASGWRSTPPEAPSRRFPKGRRGHEHHDLWPMGWVCIDVLPSETVYKTEKGRLVVDVPQAEMSAKMKAVRYVSAYLDKAKVPKIDGLRRPEKAKAKFFRSNATPLGYEFLTDLARQHAVAALPINGSYRVPGVVYSRPKRQAISDTGGRKIGERSSNLTVHRLTGRMRDHYIAAYRGEWERLRPHVPVPMTAWMLRYDSESDLEMGFGRAMAEPGWKPRGRTGRVVPKIPDQAYGHAGWIVVRRWCGPNKGQEVGSIDIHPDGEADFIDLDGVAHPVEVGLRDLVPDLAKVQHDFLEGELARHRGPEWISQRERRRREHEKGKAKVDALRPWAKRGPNPLPAHLPPMEPVTAMFRKLAMNGYGGGAGVVSREAIKGGVKSPAFIADGKMHLRKPVKDREA